ncbi:MAG TPA: PAS domain S-box protein [Nitrospirales bacterium]|nr:PAS domain S-box protein [Nitrospirales bacterium]
MDFKLLVILMLLVTSIVGTFAFTIITLKAQDRNMDLISLAGRQRMLNQRYMKEILLASQGLEADYLRPRTAFNETLETFLTGGRVPNFPEAGDVLIVPSMTEQPIIDLLQAIKKTMHEFSSKSVHFLHLSESDDMYEPTMNDLLVLNNQVQQLVEQSVKKLTLVLEDRLSTIIRWEITTGILMALLGTFLASQVFLANRKRDREIEERKKAEEHLNLQCAISRILSEDQDVDTGISRILETLTHGFPWALAAYWEADSETQILRCRTLFPVSEASLLPFIEMTRSLPLMKGQGLPGHIWQTGTPARMVDVQEDPNYPRAPAAAEVGLHGAIGFPVLIESEIVGVIEAFSHLAEPVDPDLLYMFPLLGKQIGQFIQRQQDHATIAESEARLGAILKFAHDGVISVNEAQCIHLFNQGAEHLFGYRAEEVIGQPLEHVLPLLLPSKVQYLAIQNCGTNRESDQKVGSTVEVHGRRKNGTEFPAEASISVNFLTTPLTYTIILRDITQRQAMEEALQKSYRFFEEILTSISAILISVDSNGLIRQWNTTAEKTLGLMAANVLDRDFASCDIPWDWSIVSKRVLQCVKSQKAVRMETLHYRTPSGEKGFLGLTVNPIRAKHDGDLSGFLILGTDISGKKQLEVQLSLAQKMESIGQLAAGIAHEINTPIQFVNDNLLFLKESFESIQAVLNVYESLMQTLPKEAFEPHLFQQVKTITDQADLVYTLNEIPKALDQSLDGAQRVTNIVGAMKDFSHPGTGEKVAIDLNSVIDNTILVTRNEWKYVAEVKTEYDSGLPPVPCLRGELSQVILNLIVNAAHAIADVVGKEEGKKGLITISTRADGNWAEIRITDTGTGIPLEFRNKIFDPFFTTKEVGRGTGQGLAISHTVVVKKHGGTLTFETEVGTGTTFVIRLPMQVALAHQESA